MGSEWVFPFLTRLAPPHRKTHSDPIFASPEAGAIIIGSVTPMRVRIRSRSRMKG